MSPQRVARPRATVAGVLTDVAWFGFKLGFGLISLASVWATAVLKNGVLGAKDTEEEKRELAIAQENFWSLDREPIPGFRHAFFTTSTGARLHYVTNAEGNSAVSKNVGIFIHGFPDSFLLWRHILQSPDLHRNNVLIAVDLPGYGGSDGLSFYGPYEMLEAMTEFILDMRKQYLQVDKRLVVVTHDWGALTGSRLASEAGELADRWIITSGIIPHLTASNVIAQWALAMQMLRTWTGSPTNLRLLKTAYTALSPVRSQFRRSFYIFCFHLPYPFSGFFATFGNYWFLRVMHSLGKGKPRTDENLIGRLSPKEAGESMAISTGPGPSQLLPITEGNGDLRYGESVRRRIDDRGMSEKAKIYRDGLFIGKWEKSLETTAALFEIPRTHSLSNGLPEGSLKAPTTFVLGDRDPAFEQRLALGNIKDFLVGGSQAILVKDGGHWLPLEPIGRRVLEKTVSWALSGEGSGEGARVNTPFAAMSDVKVVVEM